MNKLKTCTKCFIEKPIQDFYFVKSIVQPHCKECMLLYMRKYNRTPKQREKIKFWNQKARQRKLRTVVTMQNCKKIKGYKCECGTIFLDFPKDLTSDFSCPKCENVIAKVKIVKCRK